MSNLRISNCIYAEVIPYHFVFYGEIYSSGILFAGVCYNINVRIFFKDTIGNI
ncbi:hypothetical protein H217_5051 [Klebsiella pneumoniae DMC0799]|nr:hypothetical protein H217_5051 [Klebsiella pneumoniae DMC0799]